MGAFRNSKWPTSDQFLHQFSVHVREAKIATLESVGEFFVIKSEEMQQGGMQIVDVHFVAGGVEPELVTFS